MRFIDLFSGLGGFHIGMKQNGHECVFASEIDPMLRELYEKNHGIKPHGDITQIPAKNIPEHDIICAGFPCQPFSIAGQRSGSKCPDAGKLIDDVFRIASVHNPKFIILENVPNIMTIENGRFWEYILDNFKKNNYYVDFKVLSPHEFGIPQKRNRVFVIASKEKLNISWPEGSVLKNTLIDLLDKNPKEAKYLEDKKISILTHWQSFFDNTNLDVNYNTILSNEFGANYPIEGLNKQPLTELKKYKGSFGCDLNNIRSKKEFFANLPPYVKNRSEVTPWLKQSVLYSRKIYNENKYFLDQWKLEMIDKPASWQKMDWQGSRQNLIINDHIVQFRASGIRVKNPYFAPSLISMTPTQTPVIPNEGRYLTVKEASKLQSMQSLQLFPEQFSKAFKSLGNAVNAHLVYLVANQFINKEV